MSDAKKIVATFRKLSNELGYLPVEDNGDGYVYLDVSKLSRMNIADVIEALDQRIQEQVGKIPIKYDEKKKQVYAKLDASSPKKAKSPTKKTSPKKTKKAVPKMKKPAAKKVSENWDRFEGNLGDIFRDFSIEEPHYMARLVSEELQTGKSIKDVVDLMYEQFSYETKGDKQTKEDIESHIDYALDPPKIVYAKKSPSPVKKIVPKKTKKVAAKKPKAATKKTAKVVKKSSPKNLLLGKAPAAILQDMAFWDRPETQNFLFELVDNVFPANDMPKWIRRKEFLKDMAESVFTNLCENLRDGSITFSVRNIAFPISASFVDDPSAARDTVEMEDFTITKDVEKAFKETH